MAFVRPVIRAALDRTADPVVALERTNHILVDERPTGLMVTVLCGILDLDSGLFRFANAGHEPPLVVGADGGPVRVIDTAGPLLGAFRSLGLEASTTTLRVGDSLVLYTDGVTDAARAGGERFGSDRFEVLVREHCAVSASSVVETVMAAVSDWEGSEPADDLALLVVRRTA
jgi:sigma-B regulation protein RsbU (phosphoserine phosphatase)